MAWESIIDKETSHFNSSDIHFDYDNVGMGEVNMFHVFLVEGDEIWAHRFKGISIS